MPYTCTTTRVGRRRDVSGREPLGTPCIVAIVAHPPSAEDARSYRPDPSSARAAREFVRETLRSRGALDDRVVEVLVAELVGNAIRHARTEFEVRIVTAADHVRVEVEDADPGSDPAVVDLSERPGFGLRLVEGLAQRWGVDHRDATKVVWFELPRAAALAAGAPG
jgi:anti-sigma regulatory factor (Ser/Thr protein kinase)